MGLIDYIKSWVFVPQGIGTRTDIKEINFDLKVMDRNRTNNVKFYSDSTIYSIIRRVTQISSKAQFGLYKIEDKEKYKRYNSLLEEKSFRAFEVKKAKDGSITPVGITDKRFGHIQLLLDNPNKDLTFGELIAHSIAYKMLTGNSFINVSYDDTDKPFSLNIMPSQWTSLVVQQDTFPFKVVGYDMSFTGKDYDYENKEVIHSKYFNPYADMQGAHLYGLSPLESIWLELQQNKEGRNAGLGLLQNRGVRKVLAIENDAIKTNDEAIAQAGRVQEAVKQKFKNAKDSVATLFGRVQAVDLGLTANDLQILDIVKANRIDIANVYNFPSGLLSSDNSSYNNVENWQKDVVVNCVLPELLALKEELNKHFREYWGGANSNYVIDFDPSVFTELEGDRKELMDWLQDAPLTENEKRIYLGEQPLNDVLMDKVYLNNNKISLDGLQKQSITS